MGMVDTISSNPLFIGVHVRVCACVMQPGPFLSIPTIPSCSPSCRTSFRHDQRLSCTANACPFSALILPFPLCLCLQLPDVTDLDPLEVKLPKIDPDAMDFLKSTLRYEPSARATCDELLAHPFFEGFEEWFAPVCLDAVDFFSFCVGLIP